MANGEADLRILSAVEEQQADDEGDIEWADVAEATGMSQDACAQRFRALMRAVPASLVSEKSTLQDRLTWVRQTGGQRASLKPGGRPATLGAAASAEKRPANWMEQHARAGLRSTLGSQSQKRQRLSVPGSGAKGRQLDISAAFANHKRDGTRSQGGSQDVGIGGVGTANRGESSHSSDRQRGSSAMQAPPALAAKPAATALRSLAAEPGRSDVVDVLQALADADKLASDSVTRGGSDSGLQQAMRSSKASRALPSPRCSSRSPSTSPSPGIPLPPSNSVHAGEWTGYVPDLASDDSEGVRLSSRTPCPPRTPQPMLIGSARRRVTICWKLRGQVRCWKACPP